MSTPDYPQQPGAPPPGSVPGWPPVWRATPGRPGGWPPAEHWPGVVIGGPPVRPTIGGDTLHRSNRSRGWLMLAVFAVAWLTFMVTSALVLLPFAISSRDLVKGGSLPPVALVTALLVPGVVAALVAAGGATLVGRGASLWRRLRTELSLRWRWRDVGVGLMLGGLGLLVTLPASALWARWVGPEHANSAVGEVVDGQRLPLGIAIMVFFGVWLVAPFCEEVLFRGVLWRAMEYWAWNRWVIAALTTVLFSCAHYELWRTPLLLVISLPIALARMLTGNLLASIAAHQANNFLPAIGLLLISQGMLHG